EAEGNYLRARAETLPILDNQFDLAVSYVALIDVPDYRKAIKEMTRIVKPGGRILIANLNPFATTSPRTWTADENGELLYVALDNYFGERAESVKWAGIDVLNWHRPMEDYMSAFLEAKLILRKFLEPRPTPQAIEERPKLKYGDRVPFFH